MQVQGEALFEFDETFGVSLGTPSNGSVSVSSANGTGTIQNDDAAPTISVGNPTQAEGNVGNTAMNFVVSLSTAAGRPISFTRATADGTATTADNDYLPLATNSATIPAGDTTLTIAVQVVGDTVYEGDQDFGLVLSGVDGAIPVTLTGTGTILDDDQQPTTTTISNRTPAATVVGQPYTVDVVVTAQTTSPSGTVTVSDGSVSCGPVALVPAAAPQSSASCSLASTTAGNKTLTASYVPASPGYAESTGTALHPVTAAATTITVTGTARSRINQPTAFGFALDVTLPGGGTPTGTVTLSSGANSCTATLPATSCSLAFDALGPRTVGANYFGDGNYAPSSSSGPGDAQTLVYALSDLAVSKSEPEGTYEPGDVIVYTVQVLNNGPDAAAQVRVQDLAPLALAGLVWSCDASGGAVCVLPGGAGDLDVLLANLPVGALWNYTFYGTVDGAPEQIVNTATLTLPADTTVEDPNAGNNVATTTSLLESLFEDGFESPLVRGPAGSVRLPTALLAPVLDASGRLVFRLDDKLGDVARVYARLRLGAVEYALAILGADGRWTLGAWSGFSGDPVLSWQADLVADAWRINRVELR